VDGDDDYTATVGQRKNIFFSDMNLFKKICSHDFGRNRVQTLSVNCKGLCLVSKKIAMKDAVPTVIKQNH